MRAVDVSAARLPLHCQGRPGELPWDYHLVGEHQHPLLVHRAGEQDRLEDSSEIQELVG